MLYIKFKQSNKSVISVGEFNLVDNTVLENNSQQKQFKILNDEESKKVFEKVLLSLDDKKLQKICFDSLVNNLTVDWYNKESVISAMKVDLTRILSKTSNFDKISAKKQAEILMNDVLSQIFNFKR